MAETELSGLVHKSPAAHAVRLFPLFTYSHEVLRKLGSIRMFRYTVIG